jgi:CheY-like chemotaxis protein
MFRARILVVDDSRMFLQVLVERLTQEAAMEVVAATSLREVRRILEGDASFDVALLDLNLPDAPYGEVVDMVLERKCWLSIA